MHRIQLILYVVFQMGLVKDKALFTFTPMMVRDDCRGDALVSNMTVGEGISGRQCRREINFTYVFLSSATR